MIDVRLVCDAAVAHLDATLDEPVRFATAPAGDPEAYVVVELPPGMQRLGSMGDPEAQAIVRLRLRTVVRHRFVDQASRACLDLAGRAATAILDRSTLLAGTGWAVTGREVAGDGGLEPIGPIANHVADFDLYVAEA